MLAWCQRLGASVLVEAEKVLAVASAALPAQKPSWVKTCGAVYAVDVGYDTGGYLIYYSAWCGVRSGRRNCA